MKIVIQRVSQAWVQVEGAEIARIGKGLLLLVGIEKGDTLDQVNAASKKILNLRIFPDSAGKMNLSILDIQGEILCVSQFTLAADLSRGNRPGFDPAEKPDLAKPLVEAFVQELRFGGVSVQEGRFGADMKVSLVNDGPVTFIL